MHEATVHVYYPPGYGLHLLGLIIPYPPAPLLWVLAVLDIAATVWVWGRPSLWGVLVAGLVVSAYMIIVGAASIGPIYLALFVIQVIRLMLTLVRRNKRI